MQHPETQIPMSQPHPTPQKHHSPNANPNVTAQKSADLTKQACAVKSSSTLQHLMLPHVSPLFPHESDASRFHAKPSPKDSPNRSAVAPYCGRRRTVAVAQTTSPRAHPPEFNENPSLRIRGKLCSCPRTSHSVVEISTAIIHTCFWMFSEVLLLQEHGNIFSSNPAHNMPQTLTACEDGPF